MEFLEEFNQKIFLLDGMLIETGGGFGRTQLDKYIGGCIELARKYFKHTGDKNELIKIVDCYIEQYTGEVSWTYYHYEMKFLNTLRIQIERL